MNSRLKYQIFIFYPIHLGTIAGLFLAEYSLVNFLIFLLGWVLIHGYGSELGLHRYVAHKSFQPKNIFVPILLFFSTLSIQGSPLGWAIIHRQHHSHADSALDPHSPKKGYWYAWHMWIASWATYTTKGNIKKYKDLLKNQYIIFFTKNTIPIVLMTYLTVGLVDINYLFWFLMLPATVSLIQSYNVNLFCHIKKSGYRNFETKDDSSNVKLLALTSWGLGLHNNHHRFPGAANFETRPGEVDPAARLLLPIIKK
jgi:stearoyl-CoA desaturase (delta-9 desaturase)